MSKPNTEKSMRFRIRLLCALAGMWGVATGYAIFILVLHRAQEEPGSSAAMHFLGVLLVAVAVVAVTEWFRDIIRGEKNETFRSLGAILTSALLLAVFEVCVLAYEDVSQTTFETPYALKEIVARVSGKEIPYRFFRLQDVPEPRSLLARLRGGYEDLRVGKASPEATVVAAFGPEMQWTLFPEEATKPLNHDGMVSGFQAKESECARLHALSPIFQTPSPMEKCESDLEAPVLPLGLSDRRSEHNHLIEKLNVLRGDDDGEMQYFPSEVLPHSDLDLSAMFGHLYQGGPVAQLNDTPCNADDPNCPLRRMSDASALANMTERDLWSDARLRELLAVEFNDAILSPALYDQTAFQFVDTPEALKQLLKQNEEDTSSYRNLQWKLEELMREPESELIDRTIDSTESELARFGSRLVPLPQVVQLNRQLLVASFPGLLLPAKDEFDQSGADLIVLALLWMLAGGSLGWVLAGVIFEEPRRETHASMLGALRGLVAAWGVVPVLVVGYVLLLRLGMLVHDVLSFPHELHFLWDSKRPVPQDLFDSTLIPTTLRLSGNWAHRWAVLAVVVSILSIVGAFFQIYGRHRRMPPARRWQWFAVSAAVVVVSSLVFDFNIPFIYLLVALVWTTPAVFLGICGPYLRTSAPLPQTWGLISMLLGIGLMLLTFLRLWWGAIPPWLWAPGALLIALGVIVRAGRGLEEYWPLGALALGLTICGMSALAQRATFVGVLSDVHELNAYGGYEAKLWPDLLKSKTAKSTSASLFADFLDFERRPRSRQEELSSAFDMRIDNLRSQALGVGATGDTLLDGLLRAEENELLKTNSDDVNRWLELSIVGSLGFWLSVGLLAGWALRNNEGSEEPAEPEPVDATPGSESL